MKAVVDGVLEPDEHFERELSLCLGCRACESACPSGVQYGRLLEQARAIIHEHKTYSWPVRTLRSIFFKRILPSPAVLKSLGTLLWFYQRSGLQWLARKTKLIQALLPQHLVSMERIIPQIVSPAQLWKKDGEWQSKAEYERLSNQNEPNGKTDADADVQFFKGCIMDVMFHKTNQHTVQLIQKAGFDVHLPQAQTCCGALHAHAGDVQTAKALAKKNIIAFERMERENVMQHRPQSGDAASSSDSEGWQIVTNAGGCGAFLKEYAHLLHDEPQWRERAAAFAERIVDISEWLTEHAELKNDSHRSAVPPVDDGEIIERITYQDSCHLRHGLRVDQAPRQLLKQLDGVQFIELSNAHMCCGSAGIYNILEQEMAMNVLDHKMGEVKKTQAKTIVTSNPGCLLQMQLGIQREGLEDKMKAVHLVDFLYEKEINAKSVKSE